MAEPGARFNLQIYPDWIQGGAAKTSSPTTGEIKILESFRNTITTLTV
jgi:hypothetical protein